MKKPKDKAATKKMKRMKPVYAYCIRNHNNSLKLFTVCYSRDEVAIFYPMCDGDGIVRVKITECPEKPATKKKAGRA